MNKSKKEGKTRGRKPKVRVSGQPGNYDYHKLIVDRSTPIENALKRIAKKHTSQKEAVETAILKYAG